MLISLDHLLLINITTFHLSKQKGVHLSDMVIKQILEKMVDSLLHLVLMKFKVVLEQIKNKELQWLYQDK
jgi:Rod binding domain-containing protein